MDSKQEAKMFVAVVSGNELSFPTVIIEGDAKVIHTTSSNSLKAEHLILQDVV